MSFWFFGEMKFKIVASLVTTCPVAVILNLYILFLVCYLSYNLLFASSDHPLGLHHASKLDWEVCRRFELLKGGTEYVTTPSSSVARRLPFHRNSHLFTRYYDQNFLLL